MTKEILTSSALTFFGVPREQLIVLVIEMDVIFLVRGWRVDTSGFREWCSAAIPAFLVPHIISVTADALPEEDVLDAAWRMNGMNGLKPYCIADNGKPLFYSSGRPRG